MTRRVVGAEDEKKSHTIVVDKVKIASFQPDKTTNPDPFKKNLFKSDLDGLSPALKRKITRDINKTYKGKDGAGTKQIEEEALGYNYLDVVQPQYNLDWLAKLPAISAPHYAAIRAKQANIVGLGLNLVESPKMKRKLDNEESPEKVAKLRKKLAQAKDELIDHIDELNDDEAFSETLAKIWFDYEATGVGYLEIGRSTIPSNLEDVQDGVEPKYPIAYLGHIPSTTMRVRRKRDGYVQIISNKAVFFRNFQEKTANPIGSDDNPNEIIMIKKYSATDSFYGLPDVMSASQALAGNEFAARFNLDYFENKAVPRHVIILKGAEFSQAAETSITSFFETGLKGQNHRSLYVPLPGDRPDEKVSLEIKPVETGVQDQSFEKYKNSNIAEIFMAHRTPARKAGYVVGSSSNASALDESKTFKEQVCQPEQRMFAKKLTRVLKEFTDAFIFQFVEQSLTDEDTQSKIDEREIRNKIVVPNEIRARKGLPGYKGGDKPVELKPQQAADQRATAGQTRTRDSERSATTSTTSAEGRAPKGEGRRE